MKPLTCLKSYAGVISRHYNEISGIIDNEARTCTLISTALKATTATEPVTWGVPASWCLHWFSSALSKHFRLLHIRQGLRKNLIQQSTEKFLTEKEATICNSLSTGDHTVAARRNKLRGFRGLIKCSMNEPWEFIGIIRVLVYVIAVLIRSRFYGNRYSVTDIVFVNLFIKIREQL